MFDDAFLLIMKEEGVIITADGMVLDAGYSNDPNDSGGETKFGISARYLGKSPGDLTLIDAKNLYFRDFWNNTGCNKINVVSPGLALMLFDACVNQGPSAGVKLLQKTVGVNPDGIIGPITLGKITIDKIETILLNFALNRIERYTNIVLSSPKDKVFLMGWIVRVFNILRSARKTL